MILSLISLITYLILIHKKNVRSLRRNLLSSSKKNIFHTQAAQFASCIAAGTDMTFRGSNIMYGQVNLYNIFIGKSDSDYKTPYHTNQATSNVGIIQKFASGLSRSNRINIMTSYRDNNGHTGANVYNFIGNAFINIPTSQTSLTDANIYSYVSQAISDSSWPADSNGIYTLFFRGDLTYTSTVAGGTWLTHFCAFHSNGFGTIGGKQFTIQVVGDLSFLDNGLGYVTVQQLGCMNYFGGTSSNNVFNIWNGVDPSVYTGYTSGGTKIYFFNSPYNKYIGPMLSSYIHEIEETVTDADGMGWVYLCGSYYENGDICSNNFGTVYTNPTDGIQYNVILNDGSKYLVQSEWLYKPNGGTSSCATSSPDWSPTVKPTFSPTFIPTFPPTESPNVQPTKAPTLKPTTLSPSLTPTRLASTFYSSLSPTSIPIYIPVYSPSSIPTLVPTSKPSVSPSCAPTVIPSMVPTFIPSITPTYGPSVTPSYAPTVIPSMVPTFIPSITPTYGPSVTPSYAPTVIPSMVPTFIPSITPTYGPSVTPSCAPTVIPSMVPTFIPSITPTYGPSLTPSYAPTVIPSMVLTFIPSITPTYGPSVIPSCAPTVIPSMVPTYIPSITPTFVPCAPSIIPTIVLNNHQHFSSTPSYVPSGLPSSVLIASNTPTVKLILNPSSDSASFTVRQTFNNISVSILKSQADVVQQTIATTLNIKLDHVDIINISESASSMNYHHFIIEAVSSSSILIYKVRIDILTDTDVTAIYNSVTKQLTESITTGSFLALLQSLSSEFDFTVMSTPVTSQLSLPIVSSTNISPSINDPVVDLKSSYAPTPTPTLKSGIFTNSSKNALSSINLIITVIVALLFMIACSYIFGYYYAIYKNKNKNKTRRSSIKPEMTNTVHRGSLIQFNANPTNGSDEIFTRKSKRHSHISSSSANSIDGNIRRGSTAIITIHDEEKSIPVGESKSTIRNYSKYNPFTRKCSSKNSCSDNSFLSHNQSNTDTENHSNNSCFTSESEDTPMNSAAIITALEQEEYSKKSSITPAITVTKTNLNTPPTMTSKFALLFNQQKEDDIEKHSLSQTSLPFILNPSVTDNKSVHLDTNIKESLVNNANHNVLPPILNHGSKSRRTTLNGPKSRSNSITGPSRRNSIAPLPVDMIDSPSMDVKGPKRRNSVNIFVTGPSRRNNIATSSTDLNGPAVRRNSIATSSTDLNGSAVRRNSIATSSTDLNGPAVRRNSIAASSTDLNGPAVRRNSIATSSTDIKGPAIRRKSIATFSTDIKGPAIRRKSTASLSLYPNSRNASFTTTFTNPKSRNNSFCTAEGSLSNEEIARRASTIVVSFTLENDDDEINNNDSNEDDGDLPINSVIVQKPSTKPSTKILSSLFDDKYIHGVSINTNSKITSIIDANANEMESATASKNSVFSNNDRKGNSRDNSIYLGNKSRNVSLIKSEHQSNIKEDNYEINNNDNSSIKIMSNSLRHSNEKYTNRNRNNSVTLAKNKNNGSFIKPNSKILPPPKMSSLPPILSPYKNINVHDQNIVSSDTINQHIEPLKQVSSLDINTLSIMKGLEKAEINEKSSPQVKQNCKLSSTNKVDLSSQLQIQPKSKFALLFNPQDIENQSEEIYSKENLNNKFGKIEF